MAFDLRIGADALLIQEIRRSKVIVYLSPCYDDHTTIIATIDILLLLIQYYSTTPTTTTTTNDSTHCLVLKNTKY